MKAPVLRGSGLLTKRALLLMRRNPSSIAGAVAFPLLFFVMFMGVMRKIMEAQGFDYVQLLPSTIVVQATLFTAMASAAYVANDRLTGMGDRFHTLPIGRSAHLFGRAAADATRAAFSVSVLLVVCIAAGMRFEAGWQYLPVYVLVAAFFAVGASMAMGLIGSFASSPAAAASIASVPYLPLLMLSTGFAPAENFPQWLQPFVKHQPVSAAIDALRALSGTGNISETLWVTCVWSVGLIVVFGTIGAAYSRKGS